MFEQQKTITVNGISFNMILVEGDKFCIGAKNIELDDFYMAEIPVTQELYMAVMGPAHSGSHNMMPDNFNYLDPNYGINYIPLSDSIRYRNETTEERQKRLDREWRAKSEREYKERERIVKLTKSLPVNNVSWLECIEFIKRLNTLTGLHFALPSFEQWYFAASGGIKSKGYKFAGSDDANSVGHFSKLSKKEFTHGVYVMTGERKQSVRKPASCWYEKPMHYKPNELGLYDMSGLVNEWLDTPGKVIGGSFNSDPDKVTRSRNFGYADYELANGYLYQGYSSVGIIRSSYRSKDYVISNPSKLTGIRLVLVNDDKQYAIPQVPRVISNVSENERKLINILSSISGIGAVRSVIAHKYVAEKSIRCYEENSAFSRFLGNIYNVFVCPQNLNGFAGRCYENFLSRRKFVNHCKQIFTNLLNRLTEQGFNLLIHDELGLDLTEDVRFNVFDPELFIYNFGPSINNKLKDAISTNQFITNSSELSDNVIFIEIKDTYLVERFVDIDKNWILSVGNSPKIKRHNQITRLTLNCFCDFNGDKNDFLGCLYSNRLQSDEFQSMGIVRFMRDNLIKHIQRIHDEDFDNSVRVNRLFCKQSKGGLYEYKYPESSGIYAIQDERFYILPLLVFDEWRKSLKESKS